MGYNDTTTQPESGIVTCSCGAKNKYSWNKEGQEFSCPGWKYRITRPVGWYCGKPECYQASFQQLTGPTLSREYLF